MKIKPEHYAYILAAIQTIPSEGVASHAEALRSDSRVGDVATRLRWDLLWAAVPSKWVCDNVYPYANDTHLDTALRRACTELGYSAE